MIPWARRIRTPLLLLGFGGTLGGTAAAQTRAGDGASPWTVTVTATLNPLPIPFCGAVRVDITDPKTGQRPRNPAGALMGAADFDLSVTSPDPKAMVGQLNDPTNFLVCACLAGAVGTITASYPANRLSAKARVPGVAFQTTATVTLAAAKGNVEAVGCKAPIPPTVVAGPAAPLPTATKAPAVPKTTGGSAPPPTGVTVTGPPLTATVSWTAAPNATRHAVLRNDDANAAVEKSPPALVATSFTEVLPDPRITYRYSVVAYYADGSWGASPAVQYLSPPMVNPTGFTAAHKGLGVVEFGWQPVPGAAQYRLDGPGIPNTGRYQTATTATVPAVPPGPGTWKLVALYPGNFADFTTGTLAQAMVRVLPSHSLPFLSRNGVGTQPEADAHMNYECGYVMDCEANGSRSMLEDAFGLELWGVPGRGAREAVYGNAGDLGVGRRTDCGQGMVAPPYARFVTICYATSHGAGPGEAGFGDPSTITTAAAGGMVPIPHAGNKPRPRFFDPWGLMPRGGTMITMDQGGATFLSFTPGTNQPVQGGSYLSGPWWNWFRAPSPALAPVLDTEGPKFLPHTCIACHGGRYNATTKRVDGATLLPLDPGLLVFGGSPPGDRQSQEENIRKINLIVRNSSPSAAVRAYINGLYNGAVAQPGATAVANYVPAGWAEQAGFYRQVVKPYCAMCHLAAPANVSFSSWSNFQQNAPAIHTVVCKTRTMPHAEIPFVQFWLKDTGALYLPGLLAATLGFPSC